MSAETLEYISMLFIRESQSFSIFNLRSFNKTSQIPQLHDYEHLSFVHL